MEFSSFGKKITKRSGILELMEDLGNSFHQTEKIYMLGGGNPAFIPKMQQIYRRNMEAILDNKNQYEKLISSYDAPQGNEEFIVALAKFFREQFGFDIKKENIAITNGSQSTFFILFNLLAGKMNDGKKKKILLPLIPEYIGYQDQGIEEDMFLAVAPKIEFIDDHLFKYRIDFDNLEISDEIGAICLSRPTNPTGNVVTDEEIKKLHNLALKYNIPLIIDNAYGAPFPNVLFTKAELFWGKNIILSMSLSKCGLPSLRTGIIIGDEEIISAISKANAIISLASGGVGQALMKPLLKEGEIIKICDQIIKPFYLEKSLRAQKLIKKYFDNSLSYYLHKNEGSFFLWLWFRDLPITSKELYKKLKEKMVIIVPGEYFFTDCGQKNWQHQFECMRINYAMENDGDFEEAIKIIADEIRKI